MNEDDKRLYAIEKRAREDAAMLQRQITANNNLIHSLREDLKKLENEVHEEEESQHRIKQQLHDQLENLKQDVNELQTSVSLWIAERKDKQRPMPPDQQ